MCVHMCMCIRAWICICVHACSVCTRFSSSVPLDTAQGTDTIDMVTGAQTCCHSLNSGWTLCFLGPGRRKAYNPALLPRRPQAQQASSALGAAGPFQAPVLSPAVCLEEACLALFHICL